MVDDRMHIPVERTAVSTHSREETYALISRMFIGHRPRLGPTQENAEYSVRSATAGALGADLVRTTMSLTLTTEPFTYLLPLRIASGRLHVVAGGEERRLGPGDVCMYPPGVPVTVGWWDLVDAVTLRLPLDLVADVAAEWTGIHPADLRFESMTPVSAAMSRYWGGVSNLVRRELMAPDSAMSSRLVADEMFRTAAVALLNTFPNTAMTMAYRSGPGGVAPAALRRAVAFIDANAGRPIGLGDIATAAGISARALQYGFARHRDTSPLGYLRRVRLERAHRDLQAADPTRGDTVAAIAARWGFRKSGRFAAQYRTAYGTPPGHTLRT